MKLRIPDVIVYTTAERPPLVVPNVYYGSQVIGMGIRIGARRLLSIVWARPTVPAGLDAPGKAKEAEHG